MKIHPDVCQNFLEHHIPFELSLEDPASDFDIRFDGMRVWLDTHCVSEETLFQLCRLKSPGPGTLSTEKSYEVLRDQLPEAPLGGFFSETMVLRLNHECGDYEALDKDGNMLFMAPPATAGQICAQDPVRVSVEF